MTDDPLNIDLLRRLCETPGVPGREDRVRALIAAEAASLFDRVETDAMGSLVCTREGDAGADAERILLACHMDEIGFLVSHVSEKGFISLSPVGGFDPRNLFSRRVLVCTAAGDIPGVMNAEGKPVHIASPEDRKKVPEPTEFFVDIGLGAAARDHVRIGDFVVMDEPLREMGERIVSKALDNRVACWLGLEAARRIAQDGRRHRCRLTVAFTVQEEVGLRGARTVAYAERPDIGIGVDTTLACDTPGVPEKDRTTELGAGAGLHLKDGSFIADRALVDEIEALATREGIATQRTILGGGGMDSAALQQARAGARAAAIVVGTRYIHTVCEMIDRRDLRAARDLLAAFVLAR